MKFNLLALACLALSTASSAFTLVHTNDVMGDLEPCGCRSNPQGGLPRKANLLKRLNDTDLLQLDAGNLLFSSVTVPEPLRAQAETQAEWLLKGHTLLKHNAMTPGEKDFALGLKTFKKLMKPSGISVLAANLVDSKSGQPAFEKSRIYLGKTNAGRPLRVAVIGVYGDQLPLPIGLKALPAHAAVKQEIQKLKKKSDLIIVLSHQGLDADQELAKLVNGIDLIVGGYSQSFLQTPLAVEKTLIVQSSFRNQYIGVLPLEITLKPATYQMVGLDAGYNSPADAPSAMDEVVKNFKHSIAELNSREEAKLSAHSVLSGSEIKEKSFQTYSKCAECHLKQFDFWRKTEHILAYTVLLKADQAKNKECLACHTVGFAAKSGWTDVDGMAQISKNRESVISISGKKLSDYLVSVHEAAGIQSKIPSLIDGNEPITVQESLNGIQQSWTPVQCENCHQAGGDHPFSSGFSKKVDNLTCLKCHSPERAPAWYRKDGTPDVDLITTKRGQVTCPAGDLQ